MHYIHVYRYNHMCTICACMYVCSAFSTAENFDHALADATAAFSFATALAAMTHKDTS